MILLRVVLLLLTLVTPVVAEPWDLPSYELCHHSSLARIPNEASGISYSPVTNSLYVITRRPRAVGEYSLRGDYLRMYSHSGLRDPEGITWMYDYNFAVAQEGGGEAAITIMTLAPWSRSAILQRKLVMKEIRCKSNFCLEGVTYDATNNVFYAMQEMNPMRVWRITMEGRATQIMNGRENWDRNIMRDLSGVFYKPGDNGLYILSQTEQTVVHMTWEGELSEGQVIRVRDNVVEGLTFTPDGALMITVGEPNDLWIYSTDGSCNWQPSAEDLALAAPAAGAPNDAEMDADAKGYCNWSKCDETPQGSAWCNRGVDQCVAGCGGTWCWNGGIGMPITPEIYVAPEPPSPAPPPTDAPTPAPTPAPTGSCRWGEQCNGAMVQDPWCHRDPTNCVMSCAGVFCWDDRPETPITKADFPTTTTTAAPTAAPTQAPAAAPTPSPVQPTTPIPSQSSSPPAAEPTSAPATTKPADPSPFNPDFSISGFEAVVRLRLTGMTAEHFTPLQQLYFREAVANAAYGDADAFLVVVFDNVGGNNIEEIFSSVYQKQITEEETEEDALAAMQDGNRRLLQDATDVQFLDVQLHLLGETEEHALLLANRLQSHSATGALVADLRSRGFQRDVQVEVLQVKVQDAGVAPQYYPPNYTPQEEEVAEVPVTVPGTYQEIEVDMSESGSSGMDNQTIVIIGAGAGGALLLALVGGLGVCVYRRKKPKTTNSATTGRKASRASNSSSVNAAESSPHIGTYAENRAADGQAVQMGDLPRPTVDINTRQNRPQHRRMPSDVAVAAGLLQYEDVYTPTGTPGHSRQTSIAMPELTEAALANHVHGSARHERTGSDAQLLQNLSQSASVSSDLQSVSEAQGTGDAQAHTP